MLHQDKISQPCEIFLYCKIQINMF